MGLTNFQNKIIEESIKFQINFNYYKEDKSDIIESSEYTLAKNSGFINSNNCKINDKSDIIKLDSKYDGFIRKFIEKYPEVLIIRSEVLDDICIENNFIKTLPERYLGYVPNEFLTDISNFHNKSSFDVNRRKLINEVGCCYGLKDVPKMSRLFNPEMDTFINEIKMLLIYPRTYYTSEMYNKLSDYAQDKNLKFISRDWMYDHVLTCYVESGKSFICAPESLCKPVITYKDKIIKSSDISNETKLIAYVYLPEGLIGIISTYSLLCNHSSLIDQYKMSKDVIYS